MPMKNGYTTSYNTSKDEKVGNSKLFSSQQFKPAGWTDTSGHSVGVKEAQPAAKVNKGSGGSKGKTSGEY